jgi:dTMP kinase
LLQPDITLWFDLPAQVAATRLASARVPDKFESQPQAFFEAVAQAYAERCAQAPKRFARINADQSVALVWADVAKAMQAHGYLPMDEER